MSANYFPAHSRGSENAGWLKTNYSYSFAHYYDPSRMGFGVLRVVNDDWIAPGAGFPTHGHQNMEIITIPLRGSLAHKDDSGGNGVVTNGQVQVMSAGTGVLHSEFNASSEDPVELFQIWIEPDTLHVSPRYQEADYELSSDKTGSALLVGPREKNKTWIHQNAYLSRITVLLNETFIYSLHEKTNGVYLLVIEGEGKILNQDVKKRDGLEIEGEKEILMAAKEKMEVLCIEVPMQ
jgi:redox-sensitive bicupin YhaK (pirin superfamily)